MFKTASLTPNILAIVKNKETEKPFSGIYNDFDAFGSFLCRQCGLALFRSHAKFHSGCGWPSFDEEIDHAVKKIPDEDGSRTEILCSRCDAHLGHVFQHEGFTDKNIRHCVNALSLDFVSDNSVLDSEEAIFAAGCFWGVEYYFEQLKGVLKTEVGYTGGHVPNPSYQQICQGGTGHFEAIRVVYNPAIISYEEICRYFFEIHNFEQKNGQGPDLGEQYLSVAFYYNDKQKETIERLIKTLTLKNYKVATIVSPVRTFWPAEENHQNYYRRNQQTPYCHRYQKRF